jgi:hypothetical protein
MQGIFNNGWGQVIVILLGILVGVLFNNVRLTDLRSHVDKRIDDLVRSLSKRMDDLDKSLRDFIHSEIKRLEDRIARLEHPIFKP